jgi:hypothetical protein
LCIYKSTYTPSYSATTYSYESPKASCPAHSSESLIDSDECTCDTGYEVNKAKTKCVAIPRKTYDKMCREDFGKYSKWDGKRDEDVSCVCKKGYEWGEEDQCVKES